MTTGQITVSMLLPTADQIVAEINRRGHRVNNLYQTQRWTWMANAHDGVAGSEFAEAETMLEALSKLLGKLPDRAVPPVVRDIFS